jgi:hypothetical protein
VNLTKRLKVEPGSKIKLADIDPGFHGKHETEEEAKAELHGNLARITALQRKRKPRSLPPDRASGNRRGGQGRKTQIASCRQELNGAGSYQGAQMVGRHTRA